MMSKEIIEKYKKMLEKIFYRGCDEEKAHSEYDDLLDDLIIELGYWEIIEYADRLMEENDVVLWYS
jgi:hypothetical protein